MSPGPGTCMCCSCSQKEKSTLCLSEADAPEGQAAAPRGAQTVGGDGGSLQRGVLRSLPSSGDQDSDSVAASSSDTATEYVRGWPRICLKVQCHPWGLVCPRHDYGLRGERGSWHLGVLPTAVLSVSFLSSRPRVPSLYWHLTDRPSKPSARLLCCLLVLRRVGVCGLRAPLTSSASRWRHPEGSKRPRASSHARAPCTQTAHSCTWGQRGARGQRRGSTTVPAVDSCFPGAGVSASARAPGSPRPTQLSAQSLARPKAAPGRQP